MIHVGAGVIPGYGVNTFLQHRLGDIFDPGEAVDNGVLLTLNLLPKTGAQAAITDQHGSGAVAHHFGQPWLKVNLKVQMSVDIQQAGHKPLALPLYHPAGLRLWQRVASGSYPAIFERNVFLPRRLAAAIENQSVSNQCIPGQVGHNKSPLIIVCCSVASPGAQNPAQKVALGRINTDF